MTNKSVETFIEILGKPYQIKCPESEIDSLQNAARYLEEKMREVQNSGVAQLEKIAIIAALNIVYRLLNFETIKQDAMQSINQRISDLHQKVEHALMPSEQMELQPIITKS